MLEPAEESEVRDKALHWMLVEDREAVYDVNVKVNSARYQTGGNEPAD